MNCAASKIFRSSSYVPDEYALRLFTSSTRTMIRRAIFIPTGPP